ncbi:hypothetical protein NK6_3069 [Bradyrhizobium diazoefficiens]|uniref:Uncharacterized protein n=1 Tax=Bradyrhizobium diazoefficiens TaxID=1355477 RepID=A0A0E4FT18_9BRAD|nr:hypothetical protein NK6_3069 [Bradyrhizobium diazoefficiens]
MFRFGSTSGPRAILIWHGLLRQFHEEALQARAGTPRTQSTIAFIKWDVFCA